MKGSRKSPKYRFIRVKFAPALIRLFCRLSAKNTRVSFNRLNMSDDSNVNYKSTVTTLPTRSAKKFTTDMFNFVWRSFSIRLLESLSVLIVQKLNRNF